MLYKNFAKHIGTVGFAQTLIALKGLLLLPIIAKGLGTSDYGLWVNVVVTITLAGHVMTLGMPYSIVRFFSSEKERTRIGGLLSSTLFLVLIVNLVISAFLFLFAELIADLLFDGVKAIVLLLALILPFHSILQLLYGYLRAFNKIKEYSIFILLQNYGELSLIIIFLYLGQGIVEAVLSILVMRVCIMLILLTIVFKKESIARPKTSKIKNMLNFGIPTIPSNLGSWIVDSSDKYMIAAMMGVLFVGYYAPAYTLGIVPNMLIAPLAFMLPAVLSKDYDSDRMERVKVHLRYSMKYYLFLAIPTTVGLSILAREILLILSNQEIADNSYMIVPIVLLSLLMFGIKAIYGQIIALVKKTKIIGTIWVVAAILNFGLNFWFIPKYGIMGAAYTTLIAYGFAFFTTILWSRKYLKFPFDWQFVLKCALSSIFMGLILISFPQTGLIPVAALSGLGALVYMGLIFLMKGFDKKEIDFFKSLLLKS